MTTGHDSAARAGAHPRILGGDHLAEEAARVADIEVPLDTGIFPVDGDAELFATYLAPRPWIERAEALNSGISRDLDDLAKLLDVYELRDEAEAAWICPPRPCV